MTSNDRAAVVFESLEGRKYAASAETVSTVESDPNPSAVILHYGTGQAVDVSQLPRVRVSVDSAKTVLVTGASGDDNVRIRVIHGGLDIRTATRWTYTYFGYDKKRRTVAKEATTTFERIYKFSPAEFSNLSISGGRGADSLRFNGVLPFSPAVTSVESQAVTQTTAEAPDGQTPSDPARRSAGWLELVANEKGAADYRATSDVAMFGDSHIAHFADWGRHSWLYRLRKPALFGIGGDDTRHVLYRIQNGLFDIYKPKKLIVSVGTNNFNNPQTGGTDDQIYQGVLKVMAELRSRLPDAELVLISLLPRAGMGLNARVGALNTRLDATAKANDFVFLNLFSRFSNLTRKYPGSSVRFEINPFGNDSHYNTIGYGILADSLARLLKIGVYDV